jgi:hypothetical protein
MIRPKKRGGCPQWVIDGVRAKREQATQQAPNPGIHTTTKEIER